MGKTTAKKYPTMHGDIDRRWLLTQLSEAKYPNMLLELALHPYYSSSLCNFAYVTDDVLIDFVLGKDEMTASEMFGLCRGLSNYKFESVDFMITKSLQLCGDKQRIRQAKTIVENVCQRFSHPALPLLLELLSLEGVPVSAVDNAERFAGWAQRWDDYDKIKNREYRSTKLEESV